MFLLDIKNTYILYRDMLYKHF